MSIIYIHIGVPKTGSTAIQKFATEHRMRLHDLGLLYPQAALRGFGHHDIAFLLDGGYPDWAKPQDEPLDILAARLADECADFTGDILISSEDFYLFPHPGKLRSLLAETRMDKGYGIRVIVYLRRQDELLVSWYNQMVKAQGYAGSFHQAVVESAWLGDYETQLSVWQKAFGSSNVIARRYPGKGGSGGVLRDFWTVVCPRILPEIEHAGEEQTNISLNRDLLEIQRIVNRLPVSIIEKRALHHELMQLTARDDGFFWDAPVIGHQERIALLAQFADSNSAVARAHFESEELFTMPDEPGGDISAYPGLELDKAIAALAWLLMHSK